MGPTEISAIGAIVQTYGFPAAVLVLLAIVVSRVSRWAEPLIRQVVEAHLAYIASSRRVQDRIVELLEGQEARLAAIERRLRTEEREAQLRRVGSKVEDSGGSETG